MMASTADVWGEYEEYFYEYPLIRNMKDLKRGVAAQFGGTYLDLATASSTNDNGKTIKVKPRKLFGSDNRGSFTRPASRAAVKARRKKERKNRKGKR
jgi:hypothetical protein